ncbi:MAG: lysine--tRNA ligase [Acidobacteriota bacterium]
MLLFVPMSELDEQIRVRREKRERLRELGVEAYPTRFELDGEPSDVVARYGERSAAELEAAPVRLRVPGRVRSLRSHGKTVFLDLNDGRAKLQIMVRKDRLAPAAAELLELLDLGDVVGATGLLIRTRTGELTLQAEDLVLLSKALRPLPEKFHGLADVEARYRQRYLDLITNPESRRVFEIRSALVRGIRSFFDRHGFLEVETPMLQIIPTGAAARPFVTHHNALDLDLFLRIAPELFLKRLTVGNLHRVYEINRNFRNEGISTQHNPEFTMLEFYWAYVDYRVLMDFTEQLVVELAQAIHGRTELPWQGQTLDFTPPWRRLTVRQAIAKFAQVEERRLEHVADLAAIYREKAIELPEVVKDRQHPVLAAGSREEFEAQHPGVEVPENWYGYMLMHLFEETSEEHLLQPTFILDYPVEVSPLSKQSPLDPRFTERFELFVGGMEVANAFSELNDPDVQAERFRGQARAREHGDVEAHRFDSDYVRALEHAMPPAGGEGIGIDRLTMLFTDRPSIRDVILFPLLRPLPEEP